MKSAENCVMLGAGGQRTGRVTGWSAQRRLTVDPQGGLTVNWQIVGQWPW